MRCLGDEADARHAHGTVLRPILRLYASRGEIQVPSNHHLLECPRRHRRSMRSFFSRRLNIRFPDRQPAPNRGPRINEQIRISPARVIGAEGERLGVVSTSKASEKARAAGRDLVEVAADERPPVCKILDYGKLRFANSQKGTKTGKVRQQKLKE